MTELAARTQRLLAALSAPRDAAGIAAFRILFGLTMLAAAVRALASGWVHEFYVEPRFFFTYWGFDWIRPLPESWMYGLYVLLALLAGLIAIGLFYRVSALLFFVAFTYAELIDVTRYLNHYYLASLIALLLAVVPAHRYWSVDAWRRPALRVAHLPAWCTHLLRFQIGVVYVCAGLAKLQTDWLIHAQPLGIWLAARTGTPLIGWVFTLPFAAHLMSWAGFLFDTTIVGWLSWRRSRPFAYAAVVVFHALTGVLFPIGMFPVIMATSALVFFSPSWPRSLLGLAAPSLPERVTPRLGVLAKAGFVLVFAWCTVQLVLPFRHHFYGGDVLWHEQGMRFAWKVMVREKNGSVTYRVRRLGSGREWEVSPRDYLTKAQLHELSTQPDLIVQLAHHVARDYRARGWGDVEVRVDAWASLNGRRRARLIDPDVDLARVQDGLLAKPFILPAPDGAPPRLLPVAAR
jgi:vitamin K-dependent gamma-carboxylase